MSRLQYIAVSVFAIVPAIFLFTIDSFPDPDILPSTIPLEVSGASTDLIQQSRWFESLIYILLEFWEVLIMPGLLALLVFSFLTALILTIKGRAARKYYVWSGISFFGILWFSLVILLDSMHAF